MRPKNPFPLFICLLITALAFIITGVTLMCVWPFLYSHIISTSMILTPNSTTYELWQKNQFPLYMDFYFFNWTNSEDVHNDTIRPKFEQIGPYRFRETKEKVNVTWNENNTVTFRHQKKWYFDEQSSKGSLFDNVVSLNAISLTAAHTARDWSYLVKKGLSLSLRSMAPTVHITRTVGELLFEGYTDPMISMAKTMPFLAGSNLPPWDKFGWFYTRNGSIETDGVFNMGTGIGTEFGRLYNWKYWSHTPYFEGECGDVRGSAGELFATSSISSTISFFSSDACRDMKLDFVGESVVKNILGHKYSGEHSLLDNGTLVPENKCYCSGECVPSGALNISACRYGTPSFVSLPHFYNADPSYINAVEGLSPDKRKHEFFITLEPNTGVPLEVAARLQVNLLLKPVSHVQIYENVPTVVFPMLWFEQIVKIPDDLAFQLQLLLNLNVICSSIAIVLICGGLLLLSCTIYKLCTTNLCGKKKRQLREQEPLKAQCR